MGKNCYLCQEMIFEGCFHLDTRLVVKRRLFLVGLFFVEDIKNFS